MPGMGVLITLMNENNFEEFKKRVTIKVDAGNLYDLLVWAVRDNKVDFIYHLVSCGVRAIACSCSLKC